MRALIVILTTIVLGALPCAALAETVPPPVHVTVSSIATNFYEDAQNGQIFATNSCPESIFNADAVYDGSTSWLTFTSDNTSCYVMGIYAWSQVDAMLGR